MAGYDQSRFDPPAPVAEVTLRNLATGEQVNGVPMLLDTGADITLLPQGPVLQIGISAEPDQQYEVMGFGGQLTTMHVAMLDMILLAKGFRGKYLLMDKEYGILGRDILNHLSVLLDGPRRHWEEWKGTEE